MLTGLSQINIELSSRCNKSCFFCGHQNPKVNVGAIYGDMEFELLEKIMSQLCAGIIIQYHRDGEPTLYGRLADALKLAEGKIRSIVTNGKNLASRAAEIVDNCESLTVSAFDNDPDGPEQLAVLREFLAIKGGRKPNVNIKIVGTMAAERLAEYEKLGVRILHRSLHVPHGDYRYRGSRPVIPEIGVCLDFLSHPSIDCLGNVYICNRLDVSRDGLLGNLNQESLDELWNSEKRKTMMAHHIAGRRDLANPLCAKCEYWGVPTGG